MADGTAIGALAVRIGADASELISELKKADTAVGKTASAFGEGVLAAGRFATAAAAAGAAVFAMVNKVADTADELGKLSQKIGISVEGLSGLKYAADLSDVSLEQLGTGLKQLSKFMVENSINGVTTEEQLLRIADQFEASADGAAKTAVAMKYFGKSGADLIPFLNQGRAGIEEMRKEAERLGIVISTQAAKEAEAFNDNLTRLKAGATGVATQIAGPLVKALGDAAGAFLSARKEGEGFLAAIKRGLQELLTGSDLDKWNKQFTAAAEEQLRAENEMDAARRRLRESDSIWTRDAVRGAEQRLAAAKAEVERLQKIKPILAPDVTVTATRPKEQLKAPATAEEIKAAEAREQEVRDALHRVRVEDDKRELEQVAFQIAERDRMEREALKARLELIDYEQAEEIRKGEELLAAEQAMEAQRLQMGYKHRQLDLASAKTFFGSMSQLMQTKSKKMFEIGKAGAIAETVINTYTAAMGAYRALAGIQVVGPALGVAAAGAAIAFGTAQVQAIRAQSHGGGGGAVPTFAASPSTGLATGTPGGDTGRGPDNIIHLNGEFFDRSSVRGLLKRFEEEGRDGGRIIVT